MKQMWQVFQMTRRMDPASLWFMIAGFVLPLAAGIVLAIVLSGDNVIGIILYVVAGLMGGLLVFLIVLGRCRRRNRGMSDADALDLGQGGFPFSKHE